MLNTAAATGDPSGQANRYTQTTDGDSVNADFKGIIIHLQNEKNFQKNY